METTVYIIMTFCCTVLLWGIFCLVYSTKIIKSQKNNDIFEERD